MASTQFIAHDFKEELTKFHVRPVYGRPYNAKGRDKIEGYHKVLYRKLIIHVKFSLRHCHISERSSGSLTGATITGGRTRLSDGRLLQASTLINDTLTNKLKR